MAKRSIDIVINGRDKSRQAFDGANKSIRRIEGAAKAAGAAILASLSVRSGLNFGKDIIDLASDAEETSSKIAAVFGDAERRMNAQLANFGAIAGRSRFELQEMASDIGSLLVPMGLTEEAAANMSSEMAKLAVDLGSFYNKSDGDALNALRSGLLGESEPLKKYGVQLSALRIRQEAFNMGLSDGTTELTASAKAMAARSIIMADTAKAQGDAERTANGYANGVKSIQAAWTDFKTEMGTELLPWVSDGLGMVNDVITDLRTMGITFKQVIAGMSVDAAEFFALASDMADPFGIYGVNKGSDKLLRRAQQYADRANKEAGQALVDRWREQSRAAREESAQGGGYSPFVGPLPPVGGLEEWRKRNSPGPDPEQDPDGDSPPSDKLGRQSVSGPELVQGRLLTGLAQITRDSSRAPEKMARSLDELVRGAKQTNDRLESIDRALSNGHPVLVGLFSDR